MIRVTIKNNEHVWINESMIERIQYRDEDDQSWVQSIIFFPEYVDENYISVAELPGEIIDMIREVKNA